MPDLNKIIQEINHQQRAQVQVAQPLNDVQLVALIAAQQTDLSPPDAVAWALQIVVNAILQAGGTKIVEAVRAQQAPEE